MALIKCSECGKEISDKAVSCPKCGNPINEKKEKTTNKKVKNNSNTFKTSNGINNFFIKNKILLIIILTVIVGIFGLYHIIHYINIRNKIESFTPKTYYCRGDDGKDEAELNSISYNEVKVYIKDYHNEYVDGLKDFVDRVCDYEEKGLTRKENQIDYEAHCGDTLDTTKYTYVGTMKEAIKQLEEDEIKNWKCYNTNKDSELLNIVKNKYWCNYLEYRYAYRFDDMAEKYYGPNDDTPSKDKYSIHGNTLIIHNSTYDEDFTYDKDKNLLVHDMKKNEYLFECDEPEETYYSVKDTYHYDGHEYTFAPYPYKNKTFNRIECTNGVTATYDPDRRMIFPSANEKSECHVYFVD